MHASMAGSAAKPPIKVRKPEPAPVPVRPHAGKLGAPPPVLAKAFDRIFWMQVRSAAACAAVSFGGFTVVEIVWPPVLTVSVIFGAVPLSCSASREGTPTAEVTPGIFATSLIATEGKVMGVPGTKKSWVNCVPGLPSLARSVMMKELLLSSVAACVLSVPLKPPTPRAKNPSPPPVGNVPPVGGRTPTSERRESRRGGGLRRRRRDGARHDDVRSD